MANDLPAGDSKSAPGPSTSETNETLPTTPEPAHVRESREQRRLSEVSTSDDDDEREATELRSVSHDSGVVVRPRVSRVLSPGKPQTHWYDPVRRYWRHEIRISVPHVDCRDHLGRCTSWES